MPFPYPYNQIGSQYKSTGVVLPLLLPHQVEKNPLSMVDGEWHEKFVNSLKRLLKMYFYMTCIKPWENKCIMFLQEYQLNTSKSSTVITDNYMLSDQNLFRNFKYESKWDKKQSNQKIFSVMHQEKFWKRNRKNWLKQPKDDVTLHYGCCSGWQSTRLNKYKTDKTSSIVN